MIKKYILIYALIGQAAFAFANVPIDSVGVENNNGKKLIIHKVDPKESYYSISRRYKVNVKDLQAYNKNVGLNVGTTIKVPTEIPFTGSVLKDVAEVTTTGFFEYTVLAKDNLNLIAERFATSKNEIIKLNSLSSINLRVGQVLKVPFTKGETATKSTVTSMSSPTAPVASAIRDAVTEHTVKPKEYLGIIAKYYGVSVEDIKILNNLTGNNLSIGQVLKIPTAATAPLVEVKESQKTAIVVPETTQQKVTTAIPEVVNKPAVEVKQPVPATAKPDPSFEHIVANGETIYSIAQRYKLTTYQLKTYNNLTANELKVGQKLTIKGEKPTVSPTAASTSDEDVAEGTETLKSPSLRRPAATYGLNRIEEKGTGVWITDPDLDPTKMLILHRTAPVGTIIQVTNPMTNRSTFAKVVGKFTENETTKDVIIVMTKAVADAVGALDKRFFCNLTYGPRDEEK